MPPSNTAPPSTTPARFTVATAPAPGAIAILQLRGPDAPRIIQQLTQTPPPNACRLATFEDIDEGLVARLRDDWFQLMPHGGPRVLTRLTERLGQLGAQPEPDPHPTDLYPEAATPLEADMLHTLARAASPAAIDPLLAQPRRWAHALQDDSLDPAAILAHSDRLDRLVLPPGLVIVGRANVGKSTLANAVVGRAASLTADLPGTTRDWVAGLAELPIPLADGPADLAVRWFDTPGLRTTDDPIEQRAIHLAHQLTASADLLIALTDPSTPWPDTTDLPRRPDLYLLNKADLLPENAHTTAPTETPNTPKPQPIGESPENPLPLAALHAQGLDRLADAVARQLGLTNLDTALPWAFSHTLRSLLQSSDTPALRRHALGSA